MKFAVEKARGTKDVDFLLNVVALRKEPLQLAQMFERLGYLPVPESRNFQFEPCPLRDMASPELSFNRTLQSLLLFGRKVRRFVLVVERHQPDLLLAREEIIDYPQTTSSALPRRGSAQRSFRNPPAPGITPPVLARSPGGFAARGSRRPLDHWRRSE